MWPPCAPWPNWWSVSSPHARELRNRLISVGPDVEVPLVHAERWILVGHEQDVCTHSCPPAGDADDVVAHPRRPRSGDQHREERDYRDHVGPDVEEEQDNVVREGQQPLDENKAAAELGGGLFRQR